MALESALQTALEEQQFEMYYQPRVNLRTGGKALPAQQFDALVRSGKRL